MTFLAEFFSWMISILFILPHVALIVYGVKFFIDYHESEYAFIQAMYSSLIAYWGITNVIWILPRDVLEFFQQVLVFSSGVISLLLAQVLVVFTLYEHHPLLSGYSRIFSRLAAIFLVLSIGMIVTQLIQREGTLFMINLVAENHFHVIFHPISAILLLTGEILFGISLKRFGDSRKKLLTYLEDQKMLFMSQILQRGVFLGIALYVAGIMVLPPLKYGEPLADIVAIAATLIITFVMFISLQLSSRDPFLHMHDRKHLRIILEKGISGWIVVRVGDLGPEILAISKELVESRQYSKVMLMNEAIALVTVPGHGERYRETVFMIPFGDSRDVAICRSFLVQDTSLKDPRFKGQGYVVYGIIIPFFAAPMLKNFGEIAVILDQYFNSKELSVQALSSDNFLYQMTLELMQKIFA